MATTVGPTGPGGTWTFADLQKLWIEAGGPPTAAAPAAAIALAENPSGNANTISAPNSNGTVDVGLWQINSSHGPSLASTNPLANAQAAVDLFKSGNTYGNTSPNNFSAWVTTYANTSNPSGYIYPFQPGSPAADKFAELTGQTKSTAIGIGPVGPGETLTTPTGTVSEPASNTSSGGAVSLTADTGGGTSWLVTYNNLLGNNQSLLSTLNPIKDTEVIATRVVTVGVGLFLFATGLILMFGTVILDVIFGRRSPRAAAERVVTGAATSAAASLGATA